MLHQVAEVRVGADVADFHHAGRLAVDVRQPEVGRHPKLRRRGSRPVCAVEVGEVAADGGLELAAEIPVAGDLDLVTRIDAKTPFAGEGGSGGIVERQLRVIIQLAEALVIRLKLDVRVAALLRNAWLGAAAVNVKLDRAGIDLRFVVGEHDGDRRILAVAGGVRRRAGEGDVRSAYLSSRTVGGDGSVIFRIVDQDALPGLEVDRVKLKRGVPRLVPVNNPEWVQTLLLDREIKRRLVRPLAIAEQRQLERADLLSEPVAGAFADEHLEVILIVLIRLGHMDGDAETVRPRLEGKVGQHLGAEIRVVILLAGDAGEILLHLKVPEYRPFLLEIDQFHQVEFAVALGRIGHIFNGVAGGVSQDALELVDGPAVVVPDSRLGGGLR